MASQDAVIIMEAALGQLLKASISKHTQPQFGSEAAQDQMRKQCTKSSFRLRGSQIVHGMGACLYRNSAPGPGRRGMRYHLAAERASLLHVAAKEETRALGNTKPCFGEDKPALPMSIIEYLTLTTKKKAIAAERQEGTETNGHQAHASKWTAAALRLCSWGH